MDKKLEGLIKSLIGVNDKGEHFIRVIADDSGAPLKNAVSTMTSKTAVTMLSQCIAFDKDGNPALRLAAVEFGEDMATQKSRVAKESRDAEAKRQEGIAKEAQARAKKKKDKK